VKTLKNEPANGGFVWHHEHNLQNRGRDDWACGYSGHYRLGVVPHVETEFDGPETAVTCEAVMHSLRSTCVGVIELRFQHAEQPPTDMPRINHKPNRPFHDFVSCAHGARQTSIRRLVLKSLHC